MQNQINQSAGAEEQVRARFVGGEWHGNIWDMHDEERVWPGLA